MKKRKPVTRLRLEPLEERLALAVAFWTGGSLDSDDWSDGANWLAGAAPSPGDDLYFPADAEQHTAFNDLAAGMSFRAITLEPGYELSGNAVTLIYSDGGDRPAHVLATTGGSSSIGFDITMVFESFQPTPPPIVPPNPVRVATGSGLKLTGVVSGATDLEKFGDGKLSLLAANTFTGRMLVREGMLSIGNDAALGSTAAGTELYGSAQLRLDGTRSADVPPVDLTIADEPLTIVEDVALPLPPPIRLSSLGGTNVWDGPIHTDVLQPTPPPIRILAESPLELAGVIDGNADLEKVGAAPLTLSAANTYSGQMLVQEGVLSVRHPQALGSVAAGTEVHSAATLELVGGIHIADEPLSLVEDVVIPTPPPIRLASRGGENVWDGPIRTNVFLPSPPPIRILAESQLELAGVIDGNADLEKVGLAPLTLSAANTLTGKITVITGPLSVRDDQALGTSAAGTELMMGATLELFGGVIINSEPLNFIPPTGGGLPGFPPKFHFGSRGGNNFWGGQIHTNVFAEAPAFEIVADSPLEMAGVIDGDTDLEKFGAAPLILSAANTFTSHVTIAEGTVSARNDLALGAATAGTDLAVGATLELFSALGDVIIAGEGLNFIPPVGGGLPGFPPKFHFGSRGGNNFWGGQIHTNVFAGDPHTFEIAAESPLELAGVIDGGTDLEKHGAAALNLTAANTFTGHVTIAEGTVSLFDDQALGTSTSGTEILEGATLELVGGLVINNEPLDIGQFGGFGTPHPGFPPKFGFGGRGGNNTWTGPVTVWCELCPVSAEASSTLELAGQISGDASAALQKVGAGTLILSTANTFSGKTIVAEGTLSVRDDLALGSAAAGTEVLAGATLELVGGIRVDDEPLSLEEDVASPIPPPIRLASVGGTNIWAGPLHLDAASPNPPPIRVLAESPLELAGVVAGAAGLEKIGAAPLSLSVANTFSGQMIVAEGTLSLLDGQALGSATAGTELMSGATLELIGGIQIDDEPLTIIGDVATPQPPPIRLASLGGENVWAGPLHLDAASPTPPPIRVLADSPLELAGSIDGAAGLEKVGAAALTLSAANMFSGEMIVAEGTLSVRDEQALGSATAGTELFSGATLELIGGLTIDDEPLSLIEDIAVPLPPPIRVASFGGYNLWSGAVLLPFDPEVFVEAGSTLEFSSAISGAEDIQKLGGGTLVLSGASPDYTGTIEVQAGTLLVSGSLPAATVEVDGGTFINQGTVGAMAIEGTAGADVIRINKSTNPSAVEVVVNGVSRGNFTPSQRLIVRAGAGNDDVQVAGSVDLAVWLYGEAGNDRLKGGGGHDVLLGGEDNDVLEGGGGRDLLVGGRGADRLVGNTDEDLLIAGYTTYDAQDAALLAILAEWKSARSYEQRVANLRGTGSGPDFANRLNGNFFLKSDGPLRTVFDDAAVDVFSGSSGRDWYFANTDGANRDQLNDRAQNEFVDDVDV